MLTHPPLIDANPGDPITSEGWNNIVQSIKTLYDTLNKPKGVVKLKVTDKGDSSPITNAVVSLLPKSAGLPRSAAFVGGAEKAYVALDVAPGTYSLVVEALDYSPDTRDFEVLEQDDPQELNIPLTRISTKVPMPNLFGFTVNEAKAALSNAKLPLARIIDSHGNDVPPANVPVAIALARVLNQVPEAAALVGASDAVQLHISAKVEVQPPVKVPKLSGMTFAQAKVAVEAVGLKLAAPITGSK